MAECFGAEEEYFLQDEDQVDFAQARYVFEGIDNSEKKITGHEGSKAVFRTAQVKCQYCHRNGIC